jgi:hypothetical protein
VSDLGQWKTLKRPEKDLKMKERGAGAREWFDPAREGTSGKSCRCAGGNYRGRRKTNSRLHVLSRSPSYVLNVNDRRRWATIWKKPWTSLD